MKTAEEILNEEFGESHTKNTWFHDSRIKAAMKAYAKQALELAAERAKERFHKGDYARVDQFFKDRINELK